MTDQPRAKCIAAFALIDPPETYVPRCIAADPDGTCQAHGVSAVSIGPVNSSENVVRWVMSPPHVSSSLPYDLNDGLFFDAFSIGASVIRLVSDDLSRHDDAHANGEKDADKRRNGQDGYAALPARKYLGVVEINVAAIRSVDLETGKIPSRVRVYDSASPSVPTHVDIMVDHRDIGGGGKADKGKRKLIRIALLELARKGGLYPSPFLSSDEVAAIDRGILAKDRS